MYPYLNDIEQINKVIHKPKSYKITHLKVTIFAGTKFDISANLHQNAKFNTRKNLDGRRTRMQV